MDWGPNCGNASTADQVTLIGFLYSIKLRTYDL